MPAKITSVSSDILRELASFCGQNKLGSGHESALYAPFVRTNGELMRPELKFHFAGA